MDGRNADGPMERWRRRFLRVALPFGLAWFAYGALSLVAAISARDPRPAAMVQAILGVMGGIIFVVIWWTDRRERSARDRDSR
jgi:membrane associated rhomboid family serine protease